MRCRDEVIRQRLSHVLIYESAITSEYRMIFVQQIITKTYRTGDKNDTRELLHTMIRSTSFIKIHEILQLNLKYWQFDCALELNEVAYSVCKLQNTDVGDVKTAQYGFVFERPLSNCVFRFVLLNSKKPNRKRLREYPTWSPGCRPKLYGRLYGHFIVNMIFNLNCIFAFQTRTE